METIVVAIGGNAITKETQKGTFEEQMSNIKESMEYIADLIQDGYNVILTHGNGPQVGSILIQNDMAKNTVPSFPLDICVAETQGQIGDMIVRCLYNVLKDRKIEKDIVTILTHVEVSKEDSAFLSPSKPVGSFYKKEESEKLILEKKYVMVEDSGRGYRRVVPSPKPKNIIEQNTIKNLSKNSIVIAVGGGGIPVCFENNELVGVEAVIDKDYASALLATQIKADFLIILTGVEQVAINFNKENQQLLSHLSISDAQKYYDEGQFPKGSMGPKIQAAIDYIENGGDRVIITSIDSLKDALAGKTGTIIKK